jgi:hypothetical protein
MNKLNIGCGTNKRDGWLNLDMSPNVDPEIYFDLNTIVEGARLPLEDDSINEMLMSHVIEHLPTPLPIMEELHRVASPLCELTIQVPYGSSDNAFEDPTHVRQYFANSFMYFSQPAYAKADYGYRGDWQVSRRILVINPAFPKENMPDTPEDFMQMVMTYRNLIDEFIVVLTPVKPIRLPIEPLTQAPIEFTYRERINHG